MGLAKNATQETINELKILQQPVTDGLMGVKDTNTIHPEIYKYFNVSPLDAGDDLTNLSKWASEGTTSTSQVLKKIKNLEIKIGQPNSGETRVSKLNNWVRMTQNIKDIDMSYKEEMFKVKASHKKMLDEIRGKKGNEIGRLSEEISKIENRYRDVYKTTRARSMNEMSSLKLEYDAQLKELKGMRSVYQRGK